MLYIISAPSGAGKTSLLKALIEKMNNIVISVSYTTRMMRPGEINGVNYHFVDRQFFQQMIEQNGFLEYAEVFGHFYGTSKAWVESQQASGKDVILEIDWQGAQQVRKIFPECTSVFIVPPSLEALQKRLEERAQDTLQVISQRMKEAKSECIHFDEFTYLVINDNFDKAVNDLEIIIQANRLKVNVQRKKYDKLLQKLISV